MACVISAPNSDSGKTLTSLLITAWCRKNNIEIQTFKVGPDYIDPQLLKAISNRNCYNLDLKLSTPEWITDSFKGYGGLSELALIEGVMGLFDGIGNTHRGSTAEVAKLLNLPIILIVDARGQAASIAALIKGFRDYDPKINFAGVIINRVNSNRHKRLLEDVLNRIGVRVLGFIPEDECLSIPKSLLGLAPANEIKNLNSRYEKFAQIAEENLNIKEVKKLLFSPKTSKSPLDQFKEKFEDCYKNEKEIAIALAEDEAFHFHYQETKEFLKILKISTINWSPIKNELIPEEARGLILPGGFPEKYSEEISSASKSINSLKDFFNKKPIYAECGGMLILGKAIRNAEGKNYPMSGLLPFTAKKGSLKIGYRMIKAKSNSLISRVGEEYNGHEFHRWSLNSIQDKGVLSNNLNLFSPWEVHGWEVASHSEGWANKLLHASWIHLHWPSSNNILRRWRSAVECSHPVFY